MLGVAVLAAETGDEAQGHLAPGDAIGEQLVVRGQALDGGAQRRRQVGMAGKEGFGRMLVLLSEQDIETDGRWPLRRDRVE